MSTEILPFQIPSNFMSIEPFSPDLLTGPSPPSLTPSVFFFLNLPIVGTNLERRSLLFPKSHFCHKMDIHIYTMVGIASFLPILILSIFHKN